MKIGADYQGNNNCEFVVWAPFAQSCSVTLSNSDEGISLYPDRKGYFRTKLRDVSPWTKYYYEINGNKYPDPASNFQPEGVHGPSAVIDHNSYKWQYETKPPDLKDLIIYELHIGTFTPGGTYRAAAEKLEHLKELGITTIEIMPLSQFPGSRNWGYDGAYPFAPQSSYGTPDDLKFLIDECHKHSLTVILDAVYNHLGPEGNYLSNFGPYFTSHYRTPWGDAVNFDREYSDEVRNFFLENAMYWMTVYNFDGLRLDAVDQIYDMSAKHFLAELSEMVQFINKGERKKFIIAESDLNDTKIIRPLSSYGYGINAQWTDDFHHSLHTLLTDEREGYYMDFGKIGHLVTAYTHSFVYSGRYSEYRKKSHGCSAASSPAHQFIVFTQNHDQVGNRALGERLSQLVSFEALKLAAGAMVFSPYVPMIFMGEEFGETNPFLYFIDHQSSELVSAVREGRRNEFSAFNWNVNIPDPDSTDAFQHSKLSWNLLTQNTHKTLFEFYRTMIELRKNKSAFRSVERDDIECIGDEDSKTIQLHRRNPPEAVFILMNFNKETVTQLINVPEGKWERLIDSASELWGGPGSSAPENLLGAQQNITLKGLSITAYEKKE